MTWFKSGDAGGGYFNGDLLDAIWVDPEGGSWRLMTRMPSADTDHPLSGIWATQAEAEEALRKMVNGFDPADL